MSKIRVLIVDDAVVVRKLLSDVLSMDPQLEVAGTAANGNIALQKIPQVIPDLIILDLEMPVLDGLETLKEIRNTYTKLPVVMFSALTEKGGAATLDALALGANDYVTKPANSGGVLKAKKRIREELIPKIKGLCQAKLNQSDTKRLSKSSISSRSLKRIGKPSGRINRLDAVVIGVSTGGPNALGEIMPVFKGDFPVPILIVQHMPPVFTKSLADRLDRDCGLKVTEAVTGDVVEPGKVLIAPGDYHMGVVVEEGKRVVQLNQNPPENSCRPAVDVLFRSAAHVFGRHLLGVVLTGMGHDGCLGCRHIAAAGGRIFIQDEETSVVWGMPGAVAEQGLEEQIIPLDQIGKKIVSSVLTGNKSLSPISD